MSQDSPLSRLIGGRYQLEHRIARGGMAEVWLASDTFLHRQVAVKLLKPHLANDANVAERFRREASLSLTAQTAATGRITGRIFNPATQEYVRNAEITVGQSAS